jgi:hypothetical protein
MTKYCKWVESCATQEAYKANIYRIFPGDLGLELTLEGLSLAIFVQSFALELLIVT